MFQGNPEIRPNYVKKLIANRSSAPDQSIFAKILVINVSLHFKKYMDSGNSEFSFPR